MSNRSTLYALRAACVLILMAMALSLFFVSSTGVAHAQMMGSGYTVTDDGHTTREEAEGKVIVENLTNGTVTCATLAADDFERIGEYYMGIMVGEAHISMNAMMERQLGASGEEDMHALMGERLSGCNPTAGEVDSTTWGSTWFPMMSMMNGLSGGSWGTGLMSGFSASWWGVFAMVTMGLFWLVGILALLALVRVLISPGSRSRKK
ncbi:hypothetical protein HZA87_04840 [Candidatus Uhrbacteria bacterium]|nr:hypothetical protein [Candidatus Uhrbacteria bacterium]